MSGIVPNRELTDEELRSSPVPMYNYGFPSTLNNSTTPLSAGQTFTGSAELNASPGVLVTIKSDQKGTLYVDLSNDGINWDATITYYYKADAPEPAHRLTKGNRYVRIRFTNTSGVDQTYLRLYVYYGHFTEVSSPLNSLLNQDADATTTRAFTEETTISLGLIQGYSVVTKFGRNPDVDSGTLPEDIWNSVSTYTGFPTGSPEEFEVFSSNAGDTGVLTFTYLASNTATEWQTATVTLNGTTAVATGITGYRMHTANYNSGNATAFNLGTITIRHRVTTANVFCLMPIGTSQTYVAAYTVPFNSVGYIRRLFCRVYANTSGSVEGALWVRTLNGAPRLRRPFSTSNTSAFEEYPYGGLTIPAGADIIVRITATTSSNLDVIGGFDIIIVQNQNGS